MPEGGQKRSIEKAEKREASIRAIEEHPFRLGERQFGYMKVRLKGLAKNTAQIVTLFALSKSVDVEKAIVGDDGEDASAGSLQREKGRNLRPWR